MMLSPVAPPGGGVGGGSPGPIGGGGSVGPILAGLLLLFAAFGFPLVGASPPQTPSPPAAVPGPVTVPSAPQPAPAPGPAAPPVPSAPVAPSPSPTPAVPSAAAPPTVPAPAGAALTRLAPAVLPSVPAPGPSGPIARRAGQPAPSRGGRPVLPFTGANLLTPMALGVGLIVMGLMLRRADGSAQSPSH